MEAQAEHADVALPPYEWPSVPVSTLSDAMDLDATAPGRETRAPSTLSLDDIEAAHALEGLRAGGFFNFLTFLTLLHHGLRSGEIQAMGMGMRMRMRRGGALV